MALDWTRSHAPDLHTRLAVALGVTLIDAGRAREAYTEAGLAIERSGISGAAGGMAALVRAYAAMVIGSAVEGAPLIEPGLAALRSTGDESLLELGLRVAGIFRVFTGDPVHGLEHTSEALAIARRRAHLTDLAVELIYQAQALIQLGRLDEAERLLDEAAPLLPRIGDSRLVLSDVYADIAVERGDWPLAARLYAEGALHADDLTGALAMDLRLTAIALAQLGADEDALELDACATGIVAALGEAFDDPVTAKYGTVLGAAGERVGPDRAAAAARRGRELPTSESAARAAQLAQAAGHTSAI